jgi:hypothetical protein
MFQARGQRVGRILSRCLLCSVILGFQPVQGQSLHPVAEDIPEEVLQTMIDEQAASTLDGQGLPPDIYARQRDVLRIKEEDLPARLAPEVYQVIFLLRVRSVVRGILPFL